MYHEYYKDKRLFINLLDSKYSNYDQFEFIVNNAVEHFGGKIIKKLDYFDSRWWDTKIKNQTITFHYHDLVGFVISSTNDESSNNMVKEVSDYLYMQLKN